MNIVYGGSFNPPTLAHKLIVKTLKDIYNPSNVIIIPVGDSYKRKNLIPFNYRKEMISLMFKDVIVSDIENTTNYCGTLDTLNKLSTKYEDLYFVIGADNLLDLNTWINYKELLNKYKFIVINRGNISLEQYVNENYIKYKNNFHYINIDCDISSTKVRNNIESNKDSLDEAVYDYIIKNNLYRK